ncbi:MAG: site-2 protease family protein [Rhodopirellula sp.]|nr:site-2 protease family protein [Rhodopirellula sp.]
MSYDNPYHDAALGEEDRWDPDSFVVATVVPEPAREVASPPRVRRRRIALPVVLFLATCASMFYVGGWVYALSLMTILFCHEMGHFLQARRYGVPASLPFFIPMPFTPIGTFGAVIGMDARVGDRKALFDIGISGPLAGLVPTILFCVLGMQRAQVDVFQSGGLQFGEPLLFQFLSWLRFGPLPEGYTVYIGPMAFAGWVGLLITSLNLLPIGQLDGGHILYGLLRRKAHHVATFILFAALAAIMAFHLYEWALMLSLIFLMGPKHPPTTNDNVPLGTARILLGWATLSFILIGFTPTPFKF